MAEVVGITVGIIGLMDAVQRVKSRLASFREISDTTASLERIALLLHLHSELFTKVGESERGFLLQEQAQALKSINRTLQQVEAKLLPRSKWFDRILSKGSWQRDRARINDQLQQSIRMLELALLIP